MTVQAMGYFWVGASKLDDWTSLAIGQLGLQAVDRGGAMRAFRMDDRKQRLIVDGGLTDGERFFGWEMDATALDALAARLEKAGFAVRRETMAVADQRCAAEVISFRDPAGNRPWTVEACFVVTDNAGQKLAYVYFEDEPGDARRPSSSAKMRREGLQRISPSCRSYCERLDAGAISMPSRLPPIRATGVRLAKSDQIHRRGSHTIRRPSGQKIRS